MSDESDRESKEESPTRPTMRVGMFVRHARFGRGRIVGMTNQFYIVHCRGDLQQVPLQSTELKPEGQPVEDPEMEAVKRGVAEVLGDYGWIETDFELNRRWLGGTLHIVPGREGIQPKDIPLEAFFKKIIGIREKLRVLEQKINNHPKLDPADKLELEAYITRCYGSLTSFNVLFAEKPSQFQGSGGD